MKRIEKPTIEHVLTAVRVRQGIHYMTPPRGDVGRMLSAQPVINAGLLARSVSQETAVVLMEDFENESFSREVTLWRDEHDQIWPAIDYEQFVTAPYPVYNRVAGNSGSTRYEFYYNKPNQESMGFSPFVRYNQKELHKQGNLRVHCHRPDGFIEHRFEGNYLIEVTKDEVYALYVRKPRNGSPELHRFRITEVPDRGFCIHIDIREDVEYVPLTLKDIMHRQMRELPQWFHMYREKETYIWTTHHAPAYVPMTA